MVSKLATLRTANSSAADEEDPLVEDLRGALWSNGRASQWKLIADKASLSYSTICNMASGRTRRPHHHTITRLALAMDFRLALVPANTPRVEQEVDLSASRGRRKA